MGERIASYGSFALPKGSEFRGAFDHALVKAIQGGVLDKELKRFLHAAYLVRMTLLILYFAPFSCSCDFCRARRGLQSSDKIVVLAFFATVNGCLFNTAPKSNFESRID